MSTNDHDEGTPDSVQATIDLIKRELEAIPVGSTLRQEPTHAVSAPPATSMWGGFAPKPGEYPCSKKPCAGVASLPGLCAACGVEERAQDAQAQVMAARMSIPETFRWATPGNELLRARAAPYGNDSERMDPGRLARRIAAGFMSGDRLVYTLRGPSKSGKTSVACAALSVVLDAAVAKFLAHHPSLPKDRLAPIPLEPRLVTAARAARFVRVVDLVPPKDRGEDVDPPAYGLAIRASILVLDDSSQENSAREDAAMSASRAGATREIIMRRWDDGKPTIITTPYDEERVGEIYGGGVKRRLFDDDRSRAIEFRRAGGGL